MNTKYVVEVLEPPQGDQQLIARQLGQSFGVDIKKARGLLRRVPGVVTKPVSEKEAQAVTKLFERAGLISVVRPVESGDTVMVTAEAAETEPATPSAPPVVAPEPAPVSPVETTPESMASPAVTEIPEAPSEKPGAQSPEEQNPVEVAKTPSAELQEEQTAAVTTPSAPPATPAREVDTTTSARAATAAVTAASAPARAEKPARRRRVTLLSKLLVVAVVPALLTVAGALAVIWLIARPALYAQLLASARNPAIVTASSIGHALPEEGAGETDFLELQEVIQRTRLAFQRQNISFIVATDTEGNPISGWFAGATSLTAQNDELKLAVQEQALSAVALGATALDASANTSSRTLASADNVNIEIVSQPLLNEGQIFGAVVVGVTDEAVTRQVQAILYNTLLFSLIPMLIAILIALYRARALTRNIVYLTKAADQISRGDLTQSVDLKTNDELGDLSSAIERMRVSLQEGLERLRRRRR